MTTFEIWKYRGTKHSPFIVALFEAYLLGDMIQQGYLDKAFPGYFVTGRTVEEKTSGQGFPRHGMDFLNG